MGDIFYSIGLLIIILNIVTILKYERIFDITEWLFRYKNVTGRNPIVENFRNKEDHDLLLFWSCTVVLTVIWMLFGLLSSDWIIFLFVFLFNIFFNYTKKLFSEIRKVKMFITLIKSFIGLFIIIFLVINHFHIQLDLMKVLFGG